MFKNILLMIFLFSFSLLSGQSVGEKHSKVRISLEGKNVQDLVALGVACDCGVRHAHGQMLEGVFSTSELQLLDDHDWSYEMLIENMAVHYLQSGETPVSFRDACDGAPENFEYPIPENFEMGDLGGFLTYQQMLDQLDAMAAQYPELITLKEPIGPIMTHEGRPIYWVKISDNPNVNEEEPEVFYNAVHHAREPGGMIQLIYYMWYLLENYEDNPEMQYLVNNTEMYFVPCVNPDGYLYNEANFGTGDVFWRKNRRDNGDGTFGVDLNRNYGYEWGFDDNGSSPNPESQTYRGIAPFSEPETQNIRDFCNDHEFQICLNYHTYGDLLIYPWGYSDQPTIDSDIFTNMAEAMTRENNYFAGTGTETVGYTVNGDSDDWMYGEEVTKSSIFSMTPEVGPGGNQGFWPDEDIVLDIIQGTVQQNLTTAHLVLNMGLATIQTEISNETTSGEISYNLKKYGLQDGPLTVSLAAISSNVASVGEANTHDLAMGADVTDNIGYTLNSNIEDGEEVQIELLVDNGIFVRRDTLTTIFGTMDDTGIPLLTDTGNDFNNWDNVQGDSWAITSETFFSEPSSITDSPGDSYSNQAFNIMEMTTVVDLSMATTASLDFWSKWATETSYDYVQIMLSNDGSNWEPGCGTYSVLGQGFQNFNQPIWEGFQNDWIQESVNLNDYVGGPIHIQFQLRSDQFVTEDGFYIDDMVISSVEEDIVQTLEIDGDDFVIYQNRPNPASDYTVIELNNISNLHNANLIIHNAIGQQVYNAPVAADLQTLTLNTADWNTGVYFYNVSAGEEVTKTMRMEVVR